MTSITLTAEQRSSLLQVRHPRFVVYNYRYQQYTVKYNSIILLSCISCTVPFNDMNEAVQEIELNKIINWLVFVEPCPQGSAQGRRYSETSLLEHSFSVTFPLKFVVRRSAAVGTERFGGVYCTGFLSGFLARDILSYFGFLGDIFSQRLASWVLLCPGSLPQLRGRTVMSVSRNWILDCGF